MTYDTLVPDLCLLTRVRLLPQGGSAPITSGELAVSGLAGGPADWTFTAPLLVGGLVVVDGAISTSFTQAQIDAGAVEFLHNNDPAETAGFEFTVSDGAGAALGPELFVVDVILAAAPPPEETPELVVVNNGGVVAEGGSLALLPDVLDATGGTSDPIVFTLGSQFGGLVTLGGTPVTTFTAADIATGAVAFVHDGSESSQAGFEFSVSQEGGDAAPMELFLMSVTPMDDPPMVINMGAEVGRGQVVTIEPDMLRVQDPDTEPSDIRFEVSNMDNGRVWLDSDPTGSFTQTQLSNGLIEFAHDGSPGSTASFDFTVTSDGTTLPPQTFELLVSGGPVILPEGSLPPSWWIITPAPLPADSEGGEGDGVDDGAGDGEDGAPAPGATTSAPGSSPGGSPDEGGAGGELGGGIDSGTPGAPGAPGTPGTPGAPGTPDSGTPGAPGSSDASALGITSVSSGVSVQEVVLALLLDLAGIGESDLTDAGLLLLRQELAAQVYGDANQWAKVRTARPATIPPPYTHGGGHSTQNKPHRRLLYGHLDM